MKTVLVLAVSLLCPAAPAIAANIDLAWDDCGAAGSQDKAFACNTNAGVQILVSSFAAPARITNFIGATTELILATEGAMPPYWQASAGGCRAGVVSSEDAGAVGLTGCANAYEGSTNLSLANYENNYGGNAARARIIADLARTDQGIALTKDGEYQANVIQIRNTKSTGTGACAGCSDAVCIVLVRIFVAVPGGHFDLTAPPGDYAYVGWHGSDLCIPGPTRKVTWGGIKSLYR